MTLRGQLPFRVFSRLHRAFVGLAAFLMRCCSVRLSLANVAFVVLVYSLKMVIGRSHVMGCGKMMVLTRRVALGVGHGGLLAIIENREADLLDRLCFRWRQQVIVLPVFALASDQQRGRFVVALFSRANSLPPEHQPWPAPAVLRWKWHWTHA